MKNKFSISTIIATFFGIGFIPWAPGTFASAITFVLYFLLVYVMTLIKGGITHLASPDLINSLMVFFTGLFFIGSWAADCYSHNHNKQDPKEVVIDEVVGQALTIMLITFFLPYIGMDALQKFYKLGFDNSQLVWINLLSAFILFRVFDITKPWPINYIDKKYKNGFGVMLDDVVAAIFAAITHFFILYAIIDRL